MLAKQKIKEILEKFGLSFTDVDCFDILELAVVKLNENARQYGVENCIRGIVPWMDAD